jgi:hypothetical protein
MLLAITAAGIVGLTSFWVGQRRKQIGVRRALGATRGDILSYFLTENLLIGIGGVRHRHRCWRSASTCGWSRSSRWRGCR